MSFSHRSNSYSVDRELDLAILDKECKLVESFRTNIIGSTKLDKKVVKKPVPQKSYIPTLYWDDEEGLPSQDGYCEEKEIDVWCWVE